jgi:hypothetical protein
VTPEETIEWTYRLNEALSLGRNPKRAEQEANEWLEIINEHDNRKTENQERIGGGIAEV